MKYALPFALLALTGCMSGFDSVARSEAEPLRFDAAEGPPNAEPGSCWGRDVTPAVVETVTENILLHPAELGSDGQIRRPPVYKTETRQTVVQPRRENWFEVPCADQLTPDFIASLQRALAARGHYNGPPTGTIDLRTRQAIHRFQRSEGFDNPTLTVAAARKLGLIAVAQTTDT